MCCVSFFVFLFIWGIFSLAHCDLETWPIMEDIKSISLGSETWLREFETVTHLPMIKSILYSLSHLDFASTYIYLFWALHSITLDIITQPFHPQLFYLYTSPLRIDQVEHEEFKPEVNLAWQGMTYDIWLVYDMRIGWSLDEIVIYSAMIIEIDLTWWELACDE